MQHNSPNRTAPPTPADVASAIDALDARVRAIEARQQARENAATVLAEIEAAVLLERRRIANAIRQWTRGPQGQPGHAAQWLADAIEEGRL